MQTLAHNSLRRRVPPPLSQAPPETSSLGFFEGILGSRPCYLPILEPPDRIPTARFSLPDITIPYIEQWEFQGCRHGLAVLINRFRRKVVVVDPLTGQRHNIAFPMGLDDDKNLCRCYGAMFCADARDGHVHGDCFSSPFKLVLICNWDTHIFARLYESVSHEWGDVVSLPSEESINYLRPSVLVGNAVYWLLGQGDVLAFDFERQSLRVIEKPVHAHINSDRYTFQLLRTKDSGLGFAVLSKLSMELWERKLNCDGVVEWMPLHKTIQLKEILPHPMKSDIKKVLIMGYDEDTNVLVLSTMMGIFMLHVDTLQLKHIRKTNGMMCYSMYFPYTNFYTAVRGVAGGDGGAENKNT